LSQYHGWSLLFHDCICEQLQKLNLAASRARTQDPHGFESNANVRLFAALSKLIFEVIPNDPNREEYRQGNTMGATYRHWRRAKIGQRFRLFFRFDSKSKVIIYAWVSDEKTLRSSGSKNDPYRIFQQMLNRGHPPDTWSILKSEARHNWRKVVLHE
jgi:toxin YhaV